MIYYWFNRKELMEKEKDRFLNNGGKEKPAECYLKNRRVLKENANNKYKSKKEAKREYQRNR